MKTHLEVQQREDIRQDLAEGMKLAPPKMVTVKGPWLLSTLVSPIFQVNASRLRRPLDAVDLEEPPDSCERYGFLKRAKQMPGSFYTDNFFMSAILDRQGFMVAAPTKQAESFFSPQALQSFWSKLKKKNPKIVVMPSTVFTKYTNQKETVPSVLVHSRISNPRWLTFPFF